MLLLYVALYPVLLRTCPPLKPHMLLRFGIVVKPDHINVTQLKLNKYIYVVQ